LTAAGRVFAAEGKSQNEHVRDEYFFVVDIVFREGAKQNRYRYAYRRHSVVPRDRSPGQALLQPKQ
jgi:hypothetical protein